MSRLVNTEDVIRTVDAHTYGDNCLNEDISCILEEVPTVIKTDIEEFADYLIEWIVCKNDMEFDRNTEFNIVRMIVDCVEMYRKEERDNG